MCKASIQGGAYEAVRRDELSLGAKSLQRKANSQQDSEDRVISYDPRATSWARSFTSET